MTTSSLRAGAQPVTLFPHRHVMVAFAACLAFVVLMVVMGATLSGVTVGPSSPSTTGQDRLPTPRPLTPVVTRPDQPAPPTPSP